MADRFLEFLEQIDRPRRRAILATHLAQRGESYVLNSLRDLSKASRRSDENRELLIDICECYPLPTLTNVGRDNLRVILRALIICPFWSGRDAALGLLIAAFQSVPEVILEIAFTLVAGGGESDRAEFAQVKVLLLDLCEVDVDSVIRMLSAEYEKHCGNPGAKVLLETLERELIIRELSRINGPTIKNSLYRRVLGRGMVDDHWLLLGPSGCGKSYVTGTIHANGRRCLVRLETYECGKGREIGVQLIKDLTESDSLDGGIIFIDELHRLEKAVQREIYNAPEDRNIQVLCASSRPLNWLRAHIHEDFFGRYCENIFEIKPLRERFPDFVAFITDHVRINYALEMDADLVELLFHSYDWKMNYRDVKAFVNGLCTRLPSGTQTITHEVLVTNLHLFDEPVALVIRRFKLANGRRSRALKMLPKV